MPHGVQMSTAVVLALLMGVSPGVAKEVALQSLATTPICRDASDLRGAVLSMKAGDKQKMKVFYSGQSPRCVIVPEGDTVYGVGRNVNRSLHVKTQAGFVGWADDFMFDVP